MNENNISVKQILSGENAFYNQNNIVDTKKEMACSKPTNEPIYTHNTEKKVWRVVKDIFSVIIFPIGLYRLIHSLSGKVIVPASSPALCGLKPDIADRIRGTVDLNGEWKVKRISVDVDGYTIDAAIMGKASTLGNGRWTLYSNGNGEFYEAKLQDRTFKHILSDLGSNAIVFNYPGVGSSTGMPNRKAMTKTYHAMLKFLEDEEKGVGAKEIIGYGHSLGGGVQGDALRSHELKNDVNYVFVKSLTFSDLSTTVSHLICRPLGFLVNVFGWNMGSVESSKNLRAPEIIMQTANVWDYTDVLESAKIAKKGLKKAKRFLINKGMIPAHVNNINIPTKASLAKKLIKNDGVIPAEASLAYNLLDEKTAFLGEKYFMGINEGHNDPLENPTYLTAKIEEMLKIK